MSLNKVQVRMDVTRSPEITCSANLFPDVGSDAARTRDVAYDYALNTGDDLFLMTLYQWMVQKGKSDQLLEVRIKSSSPNKESEH